MVLRISLGVRSNPEHLSGVTQLPFHIRESGFYCWTIWGAYGCLCVNGTGNSNSVHLCYFSISCVSSCILQAVPFFNLKLSLIRK